MALGETFDLARIYAAADAAKEQRSRNELLEQRVGLQKVLQETGRAAIDPQTGEYSAAAHARALAAAGHPQTGQDLLTRQIDGMTKAATYVDRMLPYLSEKNYSQFRAGLEGVGFPANAMPEQYDPAWIKSYLARTGDKIEDAYGAFEELYRSPDGAVVVGQRDRNTGKVGGVTTIRPQQPRTPGRPLPVEDEAGNITYASPDQAVGRRAPKPASAQPKPFRFTASDTNAIYRQAAGLFGGIWDPEKQVIAGLDRDTAVRVQDIASRASQAYMAGAGELDHSTAVYQALQPPDQTGSSPAPPGGDTPQPPPPGSVVRRKSDGAQFRVQPDGSLVPL
jgi:hypothetical protein